MNYYEPPNTEPVGEHTDTRTCTAVDVNSVSIDASWLQALADVLAPDSLYREMRIANYGRDLQAMLDAGNTDGADCLFTGTVDLTVYRNAATWTCPVCNTEHDEDAPERDDGPDRDDDR